MSCRFAVRKDDKVWKMQCGKEYWLVICINEKNVPGKGDVRACTICERKFCKFYEEKYHGNRNG